ncbi:TIGR03809 family protein [Bradyrhizobium sp. WD16]|uniref:TIGR03809 family protein n=1 Tax=Bradyrhizobium sp. WD16 TaxID=1521768 RepID=UPI0020A36871|nr:TIGR03809 family protein [Bradyrhizobium sp. WD16]UTD29923.1 TIGR03809 family protein [Bradyrhizobium sp. WD16]
MAQRTAIVFSRPFAVRGLALAEQRLAYLSELYDSGRWRRFHDEADFLSNIRETKAALESWRRLAAHPEAQCGVPPDPGPLQGDGGGLPERATNVRTGTLVPALGLEPSSAALLPAIGFSAHGVGAEIDLRKAG